MGIRDGIWYRMRVNGRKTCAPVVHLSENPDPGYGAIEMLLIQSRLQSMEFLRQYSDEWRWRPRVGTIDTYE